MRTNILEKIDALELEIRNKKKELVALRRKMEPEKINDYQLFDPDGKAVKLSQLFGNNKELILIHNMGKSCPYCTLWADGFNGILPYLDSRTSFALVFPDKPATQKKFVEERGWRFKTYSCSESSFAADLGFLSDKNAYWPGVSAFYRDNDGNIFRSAKTFFGPGDDFCAIWHLFDLLPGGPGDWQPNYNL